MKKERMPLHERAGGGCPLSFPMGSAARSLKSARKRGFVSARLVASTLGFLVLAGCQGGDSPRCCHVVLVNIDTLRVDHLGSHGYWRNTSPTLDRLAREGAVFSQALATSSYTRESVSSLFTGRYPSCAGAVGWDAHPGHSAFSLGQHLRESGYFTAFLSLTTMLGHPSFSRGFDRVEQVAHEWGVSRAGPRLAQRALEVWKQVPSGRKRFFYLHFLDPHGPYDPPPEVLERFAPALSDRVLDLYRDVRPRLPQLVHEGFGRRDPRLLEMIRRYDAEIAHTDDALAMLLDGLARTGDLQDTLVVVTADHGEEFLEHGFVEHAWTLYQEVLHVPLIVWRPGFVPPGRHAGWVSTVDIAPTLLALLGVAQGREAFDGVPLLLRGRSGKPVVAHVPERPLFAELLLGERNVLRGVMQDGWKYIAAVRWLEPDERPQAAARENELRRQAGGGLVPQWGPPVREELFRLASDAREQRNLASRAPGTVAELRTLVENFASRCPARRSPPRTLSAAEAERMRVLGY